MIYLSTSTAEQTFKYIPRDASAITSIVVYSESERTATTITDLTAANGDYYSTITAQFALTEDQFYMISLKAGSTVKHLMKCYCSDQVVIDAGYLFITEDGYIEQTENDNIEVSENYGVTYSQNISVNDNIYTSHSSNDEFIII